MFKICNKKATQSLAQLATASINIPIAQLLSISCQNTVQFNIHMQRLKTQEARTTSPATLCSQDTPWQGLLVAIMLLGNIIR